MPYLTRPEVGSGPSVNFQLVKNGWGLSKQKTFFANSLNQGSKLWRTDFEGFHLYISKLAFINQLYIF